MRVFDGLALVAEPNLEPVTLAQARRHCRIDDDLTADDDDITLSITEQRRWIERYTGRALIDQTWDLVLGDFAGGEIWLPKPPLITVSSISYVDANGATQTLAADQYVIDDAFPSGPRILPAWQVTWPAVRAVADAVTVRFRAGYANRTASPTEGAELVPAELRRALLLRIEAFYDRDPKMMQTLLRTAEELCRPYRVEGLGA